MSIVILSETSIAVESLVGTHAALSNQLIEYVPPSWTAPEAKKRGGVFWTLMSAIGLILADLRLFIRNSKRELRIKTATGSTLDTMSVDFLSDDPRVRLRRRVGELDADFRLRLLAEILRERVTVNGVIKAVETLTGAAPSVFEPFNVNSAWGWWDEFNGAFTQQHFNMGFGQATYTGGGLVEQFNGDNAGSNPDPGVGGIGDAAVKYTFYVTVLNNPNGASPQAVLDVVNRVRPVGVKGVVFVTG